METDLIISADQNTVTRAGVDYHFQPGFHHSTNCTLCDLDRTVECDFAPCLAKEREDKQDGFYTRK